jgi:(R,R)-butanediol dehydrogenase/meso-butanediol dehydrogenase/diacetyl reductase
MRAVVFHGAHDVRVEKVAIPLPGPGEILLKVVSVGVCGTDAHEFESGPHMFPTSTPHAHSGHSGPMVMGHEFAGRVVSHGPGVSSFGFNELVVCGAGVSCGDCIQCDRGRTNLCERYWTVGLQADGGLAEYVVAPANICFSADEWGLSEHLAGMCQPMAIAVHATRRGRLTPDDQVIILGAGGIGAFLVSAAATVTSTVAVVDLDSERLDIALSNGAKFIHQASGNDDVAALKRNWGIRPTVVFEVSGTPAGLRAANQWLEPGGRLVLVGLQDGEQLLHYRSTSLVEHELIGTNAHVASEDMPRALEILASGVGEWSRIAPQVIPLESAVTEGLELIAHRKSRQIKTLIDPRISDTQTSNMSLRPKRQVP